MLFWSYLADEKTESQKNEAVYFKDNCWNRKPFVDPEVYTLKPLHLAVSLKPSNASFLDPAIYISIFL